ncbi:MAG: serine/threonine-protein kinase [Acidimicrobiia bacterium]
MRYERLARIGVGGMGVVDLGRTTGGARVALKRLALHGSERDLARARQRLAREAEVLARVDHPNVVRLLDVLEDGDELVLVMPYLTGGTLADRVAQQGALAGPDLEALADQLLSGLAAAHRAGVVHRDIKPGNVLFDGDGVPHLADFGVAASRDLTGGLTATGTVVGTPAFMAPEQARGEDVGPPCDVFSLGATLLFAATGEGPYGRGAPELLMVRAAQGRTRPVPRSIPAPTGARLAAMLEPEARHRPSAAALVGGPEGTLVGARAVAGRARRRLRPLPVAAGVAALVAALGIGFGAAAVLDRADARADGPDVPSCQDLPYQRCGQARPATGTNGRTCLDGFADYDAIPANGCEAHDDGLPDGTALVDHREATIVPADDVDVFELEVEDRFQLLGDGRLTVRLEGPEGVALRLRVRGPDGELRGEDVAADGVPAVVRLTEPRRGGDDSTTLRVEVAAVGSDRSAEPYRLSRSGSF